jgi:hypothetical protein
MSMYHYYNLPLMLPAEAIERGSTFATLVLQGIIIPEKRLPREL